MSKRLTIEEINALSDEEKQSGTGRQGVNGSPWN